MLPFVSAEYVVWLVKEVGGVTCGEAIWVSALCSHACLGTMRMPGTLGGVRRALDPLGLR